MNKKYRLKIPDDLLLIVPSGTRALNGKTVEIEEDNELITVISEPSEKTVYHHVKSLWLTPIEGGPVSARQLVMNHEPRKSSGSQMSYCVEDMEDMVVKGEQNDRKRTQPLIDEIRKVFIYSDPAPYIAHPRQAKEWSKIIDLEKMADSDYVDGIYKILEGLENGT